MATTGKQIVFISKAIKDYQQLVSGVEPGASVILLDTKTDGVKQIADALLNVRDVEAIHLVSYGQPGQLNLGNSALNQANLLSYAPLLQIIGASLVDGGDVLLYGSNVAGNTLDAQGNILVDGKNFITALAGVLGADVAASSGPTGSSSAGGDWLLDQAVGTIENAVIITSPTQSSYSALLGNVTGTAENDDLKGTPTDDSVFGLAGNDLLDGLAGNDSLDGGEGDDGLIGGDGNDVLDGGAGNDTASYATATASVTVTLEVFRADGKGNPVYITGPDGQSVQDKLTPTQVATVDVADVLAQNTGGAGTDTLVRLENLQGSDYDDRLTGDDAANVLKGGKGNDTLGGGKGDDILIGEDGDDWLLGSEGNDQYDGGQGYDKVDFSNLKQGVQVNLSSAFVSIEEVIGTDYDDLLVGDENGNILDGNAGNDTLNGGLGSDTASYRSAGRSVTVDLSRTGPQNTGGAGVDTLNSIENLIGSAFDDLLIGNAEDNRFQGLGGNDTIDGGAGFDSVSYAELALGEFITVDLASGKVSAGSAGNDTLISIEAIVASRGNDTIIGDFKDNVIDGGDGNDVLDGGEGINTVSYLSKSAGVTVSLDPNYNPSYLNIVNEDKLKNFQNLSGSSFDDILAGDDGDNVIDGGDGDDVLVGGSGKGDDEYNGGSGKDTIRYSSADKPVHADTELGFIKSAVTGEDKLQSIENIIGGQSDDSLAGDTGDNVIDGYKGNDLINGSLGNDTVSYATVHEYDKTGKGVTVDLRILSAQDTGPAGRDTLASIENIIGSKFADKLTGDEKANKLSGGDGDDYLDGGAGDDVLDGGAGNDMIRYEGVAEGITVDLANTKPQDTGSAGKDTLLNIEGVLGSKFNDQITGDDKANTIEGGLGNDVLDGGKGIDTVSYLNASAGVIVDLSRAVAQETGGAGVDTLKAFENLWGSSYNDALTGDKNANELNGGAGQDTLTGGQGNDKFIFASAAGANGDVISDFKKYPGDQDVLDFSAVDANSAVAEDQAFSFIGSKPFTAAGQLRYDAASNTLYGNTDANFATAEFAIKLNGVAALTDADFIF